MRREDSGGNVKLTGIRRATGLLFYTCSSGEPRVAVRSHHRSESGSPCPHRYSVASAIQRKTVLARTCMAGSMIGRLRKLRFITDQARKRMRNHLLNRRFAILHRTKCKVSESLPEIALELARPLQHGARIRLVQDQRKLVRSRLAMSAIPKACW
jgi:hypothetical protein